MDVSPPLFGNSVLNYPGLHYEYSFLPHDSYLLKAGKILRKNQNQKSNNVKKNTTIATFESRMGK